jgi:competence protein ComEC
LWSRGVKKIDVVALSDTHRDHVGGLAAVIRNFRVGEFWHGSNASTPGYEALLEQVWGREIPDRTLVAGDLIPLGGARIRILWPPVERSTLTDPSDHDSVVMLISAGEAGLLLTGDITDKVQQELLASEDSVESLALVAIRQGPKSKLLPEFLARVSPRVAITSLESDSPDEPQERQALEGYQKSGVQVLRPDQNGAVTVEIRGSSLSVRTYRGLARD